LGFAEEKFKLNFKYKNTNKKQKYVNNTILLFSIKIFINSIKVFNLKQFFLLEELFFLIKITNFEDDNIEKFSILEKILITFQKVKLN
jgi:hypothetical protein